MVNFENKARYDVSDFKKIVSLLRGPGGCPWDREQTHESIRRNFLEEAYEAVEAIDEKSTEHLQEELGDVLMQVIFHADIEAAEGRFDLDDVADMAVKKLISRHPHVFGDVAVTGSDDVLVNWDKLKQIEKNQATTSDTLSAVAKSLPGLWRAEKIQKKAAKVGFDWPDMAGALQKLREEVQELSDAIDGRGNPMDELGDVLFSAVNVARFLSADPEEAVHGTCEKFNARFRRLEEMALEQGQAVAELPFEELDRLYEAAKSELRKQCDASGRVIL